MNDDLQPDPNAAAYGLRDPRAPARLAGRSHVLELNIDERFMTVADGFVQGVWSIDRTVPGPVIRVMAGEVLRIRLVNDPPEGAYPAQHPAVNAFPHALEFHGSTGAREEQRTPVQPRQETAFELTTGDAGVWMYHGSTEPVLQSLANGLYGMLIVEPEGGLQPVDQELFFVQGEWYLGGQYPPHPPLPSLEKAAAAVPDPDFVVLNGIADQYLDHPIEVETGKRIRVFLLNAGPNLDMSFRIDGAAFERVVMEGVELSTADGPGWRTEAVGLSPGQGAIVEFTLPEAGPYPFQSHAGRGAAGLFQAGEAEP